ncbi:phosphoribosylanthranilate isomerase [Rhodoflexus sp.]
MQWKICGLKDPANIAAILDKVQPDYAGLIFYRGSSRFMGELPPEDLPVFPSGTKKVGVFVNQSAAEISRAAADYGLQLLQLHGNEAPDFCYEMRLQTGLPVIKAFAVGQTFDFVRLATYEQAVDFFLFDTQGKNHGGNGVTFNWELLQNYASPKPFFLSGGIGIEQATAINELQLPMLYAIDVNSRFEIAPGLKDVELLLRFKQELSLS